MQLNEEVTPSTSFRKRIKKTSFRYSTMKELQKAREYKSKKKLITHEPGSKNSNTLKRLQFLKMAIRLHPNAI
jgi:hypothetical protein